MSFFPDRISLEQPQLIEASAGTGKTYTMTNLYLRLLLGRGRVRPLAVQEILVLTFTIAATQELKHRIRERILATRSAFDQPADDEYLAQLVADSTSPERDRKLLTAASQMMDEAAIFTIHGFCARALQEQSFEAGVLFDQELNGDAEHLLLLAAQDYFRSELLTMEPVTRDIALRLWPEPLALAKAIKPLLFRPGLKLTPSRPPRISAGELAAKMIQAKRGWIEYELESLVRASQLHGGKTPHRRLASMTDFCEQSGVDLSSDLWQIYSAKSIDATITSKSTRPEHAVLDLLDEIAGDLSELGVFEAQLWQRTLEGIRQRIEHTKVTRQLMTLDDLLVGLAAALDKTGSTLAQSLASRWPVAMIDEFQDTDDIQSRIFNRIYTSAEQRHDAADAVLLMIGDPKQAIYTFRGADVYTYLNTRRSIAQGIHSLDINWRSSPSMIQATNFLFQERRLLDAEGEIPFSRVTHPPEHAAMSLKIDGCISVPYKLVCVGDPQDPKTLSNARDNTIEQIAEETALLLNGAAEGKVLIDDKPLTAGNIAFLVRSRADAELVRIALARRNIQSVYLTLESVLLQDTAMDLQIVLRAVIEPASDQAIKAALATRLMQGTAQEIERLNEDLTAQQDVLQEFAEYHDLWLRENVGPMINALISRRKLPEKWLHHPDGERQLTNLRHLTEVLQSRAAVAPGMHRLMKWFRREQLAADSMAAEERQLRLESDENLVKIVTMHAAKGLEYDVVMLPYPIFNSTDHKNVTPVYHTQNADGLFEVFSEVGGDTEHTAKANLELDAEDARLLYVALTRARYLCYLGIPVSTDKKLMACAFARILGFDGLEKGESLSSFLRTALPSDLFEVTEVDGPGFSKTSAQDARSSLTPPIALPVILDNWRMHSYTSVANRISTLSDAGHQVGQQVGHHVNDSSTTGFDDDDTFSNTAESLATETRARSQASSGVDVSRSTYELPDRHNFPRGARVGVALHSLMEDADFTEPAQYPALCERTLLRIGLTEERERWQGILETWLADILQTPLDAAGKLRLAAISRDNRLDELEFHFPIESSARLFSAIREQGYLTTRQITPLNLNGMMTGLIDLVFRHDGRYYIVDYKSNHLGPGNASYLADSISHAMTSHQYDLQYLIYTVALNRYLASRIVDYDYDTHFGGIYYLFLRGMDGKSNATGIFYDRPDAGVIARLDGLVACDRDGNGA